MCSTCKALAAGGLTVEHMKRVMRDHYDGGEVYQPGRVPDDERYFSVCMHADPVGTTTASMVVELDGDPARPLLAWMALTNPCIAPYLPVFVGAKLPTELTDGEGAWRRFKDLLTEVEKDFAKRGPYVRAFWKDFEAATAETLSPDTAADAASRQGFVDRTWSRASDALHELTGRVRSL